MGASRTTETEPKRALVLIHPRDLTRVALLRAFSQVLTGTFVFAIAHPCDLAGQAIGQLRVAVLYVDQFPLAQSIRSDLQEARTVLGDVPIVILAERGEEQDLAAASEHGASAYLTTSMPLDLAAATLQLVIAGGTAFPAGLRPPSPHDAVREPAGIVLPIAAKAPGLERLTTREEDVLRLVGEGAQNKIIAFRLNMSENTVKVHLHRILQKFRLHNRTEAALAAPRYFAAGAGFSAISEPLMSHIASGI